MGGGQTGIVGAAAIILPSQFFIAYSTPGTFDLLTFDCLIFVFVVVWNVEQNQSPGVASSSSTSTQSVTADTYVGPTPDNNAASYVQTAKSRCIS